MKRKETYTGEVLRSVFPDTGIVSVDGRDVHIKHALRGQTVRFSITKVRQSKCEGRLLEVLEKAADEEPSSCPRFDDCGGCAYRNLSYDAELALKENQIRELLADAYKNIDNADYEFQPIHRSPLENGYRNKMEFTFGDEYKDGPLSLGLHKRNGFYDIVPVRECGIINEDYRKILCCTLDYFQEQNIPYYHRMRHTGYLRHLLVREGHKTGEILIDLVTTTEGGYDDVPWVSRLFELKLDGEITGILHTYNNSLSDTITDGGTKILYGHDFFDEELLGLKFRITPFSFFQTNSAGAEVLYSTVRDYIGDTSDKEIFDLYCGTGTIAQILAEKARKVTGVELVEEAVEAAKHNAVRNGLDNCTFIAGDVKTVMESLDGSPDLIVLDPPREGVHPRALTEVIGYGAEKIVYVSCKPTSLVRDLKILEANGYHLVKATAVDLFPRTGHVETVVLMSRVKE